MRLRLRLRMQLGLRMELLVVLLRLQSLCGKRAAVLSVL
jgi:hypothetical protein